MRIQEGVCSTSTDSSTAKPFDFPHAFRHRHLPDPTNYLGILCIAALAVHAEISNLIAFEAYTPPHDDVSTATLKELDLGLQLELVEHRRTMRVLIAWLNDHFELRDQEDEPMDMYDDFFIPYLSSFMHAMVVQRHTQDAAECNDFGSVRSQPNASTVSSFNNQLLNTEYACHQTLRECYEELCEDKVGMYGWTGSKFTITRRPSAQNVDLEDIDGLNPADEGLEDLAEMIRTNYFKAVRGEE